MKKCIALILCGVLLLSACSGGSNQSEAVDGESVSADGNQDLEENASDESGTSGETTSEETTDDGASDESANEVVRLSEEELLLSPEEVQAPIRELYRGLTPEGMTEEEVTERLVEHYNMWKAQYVKDVPGQYQKYVDYIVDERTDPDVTWCNKQAVTVSEAHGYGMLILVNMANIDGVRSKVYQRDFDDFVRFYDVHRSTYVPTFMCWQMITYGYDTDGQGEVTQIINSPEGASCATDGDLDIAYSFVLADRIWGSDGDIDYLSKAKVYSRALLDYLVTEEGRLWIADWVKDSVHHQHLTRTSDLLVRNMYALREIDAENEARWTTVITETEKIVNQLHTEYSGGTGLMPDFITYKDGNYAPVDGYVLEDSYDGDNNWNACRTPWRIGQHALYSETDEYTTYLTEFSNWAKEVTGGDPANYSPGYMIVSGETGEPIPDRDYTDLAFTAPLLLAASMANDVEWYNAIYQYLDQAGIEDSSYFGNTIKMQVLLDATGQSLN